jgi:hypothetical protein
VAAQPVASRVELSSTELFSLSNTLNPRLFSNNFSISLSYITSKDKTALNDDSLRMLVAVVVEYFTVPCWHIPV